MLSTFRHFRGLLFQRESSHSRLEDADAAGVFHIPHRSGDGYVRNYSNMLRGLGRYRNRAESLVGAGFCAYSCCGVFSVREPSAAELPGLWCGWRGPARGREHF